MPSENQFFCKPNGSKHSNFSMGNFAKVFLGDFVKLLGRLLVSFNDSSFKSLMCVLCALCVCRVYNVCGISGWVWKREKREGERSSNDGLNTELLKIYIRTKSIEDSIIFSPMLKIFHYTLKIFLNNNDKPWKIITI